MISARDVFLQLTSGPSLMDSVCDLVIRPPRSSYEMDDLGPEVFRIGDDGTERFMRHDFELENMRGMRFQCSWFKPYPARRVPCVVYCHANCGGRYDGLEALCVLREGFSLFCFDFCGSGMSEGEYISLGFYERQDLVAVAEFLTLKSDEVDGVALWGRSMGAVAAIMYAAKDSWIRCIVCDSPFASLRLLINDLVERHGGRTARVLPGMVVRGVVERIRRRVMKRASFDIDDLDSVKYARACRVPALLFHGADDDFVSPAHSERIRDAFPTPCLQQFTPGGHNDERDDDIHDLIIAFLRLYLVDKPQGAREQQALRELEAASLAVAVAASAAPDVPKSATSRPSAPAAAPAPKQPVPPASRGMRCAGAERVASSCSTTTSTTSSTSSSSSPSSSPVEGGRLYTYGVESREATPSPTAAAAAGRHCGSPAPTLSRVMAHGAPNATPEQHSTSSVASAVPTAAPARSPISKGGVDSGHRAAERQRP
ncbi:Alpha/beta hydrolase family/X-Pro dipeptidyl-peptidase (S15 family) [Novymonas esmeraldas]|uniref:Alpha/beta hydrolase family/X-Pro dipeptidyl-peptidase (S15 family) n=1 Tax=Novymonas esmeraldas TaxID=1808958 RepID=A0AAW0F3B5_9TRYP